jgi:hypothetical protein
MVWFTSLAAVHGGPVTFDVGPVVLVVEPSEAAGTELVQPGNWTVRVNEPGVHPHDEKVMLEAAWAVELDGVRDTATFCDGPTA